MTSIARRWKCTQDVFRKLTENNAFGNTYVATIRDILDRPAVAYRVEHARFFLCYCDEATARISWIHDTCRPVSSKTPSPSLSSCKAYSRVGDNQGYSVTSRYLILHKCPLLFISLPFPQICLLDAVVSCNLFIVP